MKTILVIGDCGCGKTWVMEQLIKKYKLCQLGKVGMFYYHRNEDIIVLGKYDGSTFQGSDRLSMAVMRDLEQFKKFAKGKTVICEGDRFMNSTFIKGTNPTVVKIINDGKEGRKKRGSRQTERQLKSIHTRVEKIPAKHNVLNSKIALQAVVEIIA